MVLTILSVYKDKKYQ